MVKAWEATANTSSGYLSMRKVRVIFFFFFLNFYDEYVVLIIFQFDKKDYKDFVGI